MTANVTGYDITSINPSNISIVEGTDDYKFTIEATGILILKITDTSDSANGGTPVVAAEFYRTDSDGSHTFNADVQSVTMTVETYTFNIANPKAALRTFAIEDSNYSGLAIETVTLTLESGE